MLLTRWARAVDRAAPDAWLTAWVAFWHDTLGAQREPPALGGVLGTLSEQGCRDVHLLELPRWRAAVLAHAEQATAPIDAGEYDARAAAVALGVLARAPADWISRQDAQRLAPRVWQLTTRLLPTAAETAEGQAHGAHVQRLLVRWWDLWAPSVPVPSAPLPAVLSWIGGMTAGPLSEAFQQACMDLLGAVLRHATDNAPGSLAALQRVAWQDGGALAARALATVLEYAVAHAPAWRAAAVDEVGDALALPPLLASLPTSGPTDPNLAWRLRAAVSSAQLAPPTVALRDEVLAELARALPAAATAPLASALFHGLMTLGTMDDAPRHVLVLVAAAHLPMSATGHDGVPALAKIMGQLSAPAYEHALQGLYAMLEASSARSDDDVAVLIRAVSLALQHGPLGTSKVAGHHLSALLLRVTALVTARPALVPAVVEAVGRVCQSRARLLRPFDVPRILAVLGLVVAPRDTPSPAVAVDADGVYSGVCTALHALVRQRKDLLMPCLPQLTDLLAQQGRLLSRLVRQHPGQATLREVSAQMPAWLDVLHAPLGVAAARAWARLLTELGAKTAVAHPVFKAARVDRPSATESIRKPMTKHAVHILVAYVRCVTMGPTTIPVALRQELQPGLFTICDLCGEYERDAALKNMLDASGQLIFKSLWRDYERQRYRGD